MGDVAGSGVGPGPHDKCKEAGVGHDQAADMTMVVLLHVLPAHRQHVLALLHTQTQKHPPPPPSTHTHKHIHTHKPTHTYISFRQIIHPFFFPPPLFFFGGGGGRRAVPQIWCEHRYLCVLNLSSTFRHLIQPLHRHHYRNHHHHRHCYITTLMV